MQSASASSAVTHAWPQSATPTGAWTSPRAPGEHIDSSQHCTLAAMRSMRSGTQRWHLPSGVPFTATEAPPFNGGCAGWGSSSVLSRTGAREGVRLLARRRGERCAACGCCWAASSERLGVHASRHDRAKAAEPRWGLPRQADTVSPHVLPCALLTLMCTQLPNPDYVCRYSHGINLPCEWGRAVPCNGPANTSK